MPNTERHSFEDLKLHLCFCFYSISRVRVCKRVCHLHFIGRWVEWHIIFDGKLFPKTKIVRKSIRVKQAFWNDNNNYSRKTRKIERKAKRFFSGKANMCCFIRPFTATVAVVVDAVCRHTERRRCREKRLSNWIWWNARTISRRCILCAEEHYSVQFVALLWPCMRSRLDIVPHSIFVFPTESTLDTIFLKVFGRAKL